jgi:anti-sigma factor RsiW
MSRDPHAAAQTLILKDRVEGLTPAERASLDRHLDDCPACARRAAATEGALRELRAVVVSLPPDLAARTHLRVYLRARERRPAEGASWALWVSFGLSWAVGVASAPWVWRGFNWVGSWAGIPALLVKMSFALWWAIPALLTVAILLLERGRQGDELW